MYNSTVAILGKSLLGLETVTGSAVIIAKGLALTCAHCVRPFLNHKNHINRKCYLKIGEIYLKVDNIYLNSSNDSELFDLAIIQFKSSNVIDQAPIEYRRNGIDNYFSWDYKRLQQAFQNNDWLKDLSYWDLWFLLVKADKSGIKNTINEKKIINLLYSKAQTVQYNACGFGMEHNNDWFAARSQTKVITPINLAIADGAISDCPMISKHCPDSPSDVDFILRNNEVISNAITPGMSGGGLYNHKGELTGIIAGVKWRYKLGILNMGRSILFQLKYVRNLGIKVPLFPFIQANDIYYFIPLVFHKKIIDLFIKK